MERELELAGAASIGGWLRWRHKHAVEPGTPCANCGTPLQGPYCHECGQLGEGFHRSIWHLAVEAIESFFHFDGRLWRTIPKLVWKPGELTSDYLEGKRASQIPPLRLFLVVLLITFFAGTLPGGAGHHSHTNVNFETRQAQKMSEARAKIEKDPKLSPAERDAALRRFDKVSQMMVGKAVPGVPDRASASPDTPAQAGATPAQKAAGAVDAETDRQLSKIDQWYRSSGFKQWAVVRADAIKKDPERFTMVLESQAHRMAILTLPVSALLLTLLFAFNRRFYVFDHLIFSMHSLSFQLLLLTTVMLLSRVTHHAGWLFLLAPVHLFRHMRGVYQTGVFMTLLRMALLFIGSAICFSILALAWLFLGFNAMAEG